MRSVMVLWCQTFQSTLPMKGATARGRFVHRRPRVSIHAPNEGSDPSPSPFEYKWRGVSIHAPNEGSDGVRCRLVEKSVFQSTLPMKGATIDRAILAAALLFQSTLPMKGATKSVGDMAEIQTFQSTLPMKGATQSQRHFSHSNIGFNPRSQ